MIPIDLYVTVVPGELLRDAFLVDGRAVCRVDASHDPDRYIRFAGSFELEPGATMEFSDVRWETSDFGPVTRPLMQTGNFGERFDRYASLLDDYGRAAFGERWYPHWISSGSPVETSALDVAERRLGYPLPREFRELLLHLGQVAVAQDHRFSPADLRDTYELLTCAWGLSPGHLADILEPETAELFRATTLLFTEIGDGCAGLIYGPNARACGAGPAFWFFDENSINEPRLLRTTSGSCSNFAQAVHWWLDGKVTTWGVQDKLEGNTLLVDSNCGRHALLLYRNPHFAEDAQDSSQRDPFTMTIHRFGTHRDLPGSIVTAGF